MMEITEAVMTSMEALNAPQASAQHVTAFEQAFSGDQSGLGASALNELGRIKEQFGHAKKELEVRLSSSSDNPADLMQIQWSLMRITLQEELIAKTVGRLTQNVETLMKAQ